MLELHVLLNEDGNFISIGESWGHGGIKFSQYTTSDINKATTFNAMSSRHYGSIYDKLLKSCTKLNVKEERIVRIVNNEGL